MFERQKNIYDYATISEGVGTSKSTSDENTYEGPNFTSLTPNSPYET